MENLKFTTYLKTARNNISLLISFVIFSLLFLPFINSFPYLDGNIDFVKSYYFFNGGFDLYFSQFSSIHPPLKIVSSAFLLQFFGLSSIGFNLFGYILGVLGIIGMYFLTKKVSSKPSAEISTIIFSMNPLLISTAFFSLIDYVITIILIWTLLVYLQKKHLLFSLLLCLIILTKETGLLIVGTFLLLDITTILLTKKSKQIKYIFFYIIPIAAYYIWDNFLNMNGKGEWSDWIFTDTADQGTFYTIVNNVVTLKIFNEYATQHFLQLLFLNFNWIIIAISIFITIIILIRKENRKKIIQTVTRFDAQTKTILFILIFCILYALTVLTFQTYTIPRYALPIIPFLLLWFSVVVTQLKNFFVKATSIFVVFLLTILGLFFSVDPIANTIWGKVNVLGQNVYATNYHLSGNDGITYNYQYLLIAKKRTEIIRQDITFPQEYCRFLFPDPQNDSITAYLLEFSHSKAVKKCGLVSSGQEY